MKTTAPGDIDMAVVTHKETLAAVGKSTAVRLPALANPRMTGMVIITGSPTYTVEYSLDGTNYLPLATDLTSQTVNKDFTVVFPTLDIRVDFVSGTGTVALIARFDKGGF
jgi:hypothetical protein